MRKTGPFVLLSVAAIVGSTALIFQLSEYSRSRGEFGDILLVMCADLGFFIVIVAGIGVLLDDLKPGLHTFWRSRPINPDLWFWAEIFHRSDTYHALAGNPPAAGTVDLNQQLGEVSLAW